MEIVALCTVFTDLREPFSRFLCFQSESNGTQKSIERKCGKAETSIRIRESSSQPCDWKSSWKDFSEVRVGFGQKFPEGA